MKPNVEIEEKKIILLRRPKLSTGQKVLFDLICEKLKSGDKLTIEESRKIYIKNVCRSFENGKPAVYNYYYKRIQEPKWNKDGKLILDAKFEGRYEPMTEQYLNLTVLQWLTHNIGALVLKGYLKVLPIIEF